MWQWLHLIYIYIHICIILPAKDIGVSGSTFKSEVLSHNAKTEETKHPQDLGHEPLDQNIAHADHSCWFLVHLPRVLSQTSLGHPFQTL